MLTTKGKKKTDIHSKNSIFSLSTGETLQLNASEAGGSHSLLEGALKNFALVGVSYKVERNLIS